MDKRLSFVKRHKWLSLFIFSVLCGLVSLVISPPKQSSENFNNKTPHQQNNEAKEMLPKASLGEVCFSFSNKDSLILAEKDYWSWTEDKTFCKNSITETEIRDSLNSLGFEYCNNYNVRLKVKLNNINIENINLKETGVYAGKLSATRVKDSIVTSDFSNNLELQNIGEYFTVKDEYLYLTLFPYGIESYGESTVNIQLKVVTMDKQELKQDINLAIPDPFKCVEE